MVLFRRGCVMAMGRRISAWVRIDAWRFVEGRH